MEYIAVAIGGMLGAMARYAVANWVARINGTHFPYGTLLINVSGSFLLGLLATLFLERFAVDPLWRLLLTVGFLGAYTTFSTVSLESLQLLESGMFDSALLNIFGSMTAGVFAAWLGVLAARGV